MCIQTLGTLPDSTFLSTHAHWVIQVNLNDCSGPIGLDPIERRDYDLSYMQIVASEVALHGVENHFWESSMKWFMPVLSLNSSSRISYVDSFPVSPVILCHVDVVMQRTQQSTDIPRRCCGCDSTRASSR